MEDRLFDFEEIFYLFKKKFWIIIVVTAITTSLAVVKVSKLQPSYSATAKIFMGNGNDMLQVYSESELSYYSQFITIFSEISKIDGFLDNTLNKRAFKSSLLSSAKNGFIKFMCFVFNSSILFLMFSAYDVTIGQL